MKAANPFSNLKSIEASGRLWLFEIVFCEIQDLFFRHGIEVIVMKGPQLAYMYYPQPALRYFIDLDLLVKPDYFMKAARLLLQNDYVLREFDGRQSATFLNRNDWQFISPRGVPIELHREYAAYSRYVTDHEGIFSRRRPFCFGKASAYGLDNEDLLVYLCIHMAKSFFWLLEKKHLLDIAQIIKKECIDWSSFIRRVKKSRCCIACFYALSAAGRQHAAAVPEGVLEALRPGYLRRLWLDRFLDMGSFPLYCFPDHKIEQVKARLTLALIDRFRDAIMFFYRVSWGRFKDILFRCWSWRRLFLRNHPLREWIEEELEGRKDSRRADDFAP